MNDSDVYDAIGNGNITDFDDIDEIRDYFTVENFNNMFYESGYTETDIIELRAIAERMFEEQSEE